MAQTIRLTLPPDAPPILCKAAELFQRTVEERCGARVVRESAELTVELALQPGLGAEGFEIADGPTHTIRVLGNDERGVLYGVGKLLRSSRYSSEGFEVGTWRGVSVPQKSVRGIYFATHFHNFYHDAPLEKVQRYVEELALWGINTLSVWFDMHHYESFQDPAAQEMITRLQGILSTAREVGITPSTGFLANEGYAGSPPELRATWGCGDRHLPAHYHTELCPNVPGAMDQLLRWTKERLVPFVEAGLGYLWLWPYDQGGCCCHQCHPWGGNGFLKCAEQVARLAKREIPDLKIVLSTWDFNSYYPGEWEGLAQAMAEDASWVDYIMADGREGHFPEYPVKHGSPGGLPLIGFPEISMIGHTIWGGWGANPAPVMMQGLWNQGKGLLSGGYPYSEGIFEDLNKMLFAGFYWDPDRSAEEIVREYVGYEFSPEVIEEVTRAIGILERTLPRAWGQTGEDPRFPIERPEGIEEAEALLWAADAKLPEWARRAWRWRILLLRGLIDGELLRNDFHTSEAAETALEELTAIYHAEHAGRYVAPPTKAARRAQRPC